MESDAAWAIAVIVKATPLMRNVVALGTFGMVFNNDRRAG